MLTTLQKEQLQHGAGEWGLDLSAETVDKFARLATMLEVGNLHLNLTRVAPEDVVTLHFLDSLALAAALTPGRKDQLIDVGTGAGFPGLPLAIVFPELRVTLLDGTRKRLDFIDSVITELGLSHASTLHGRAEEIGRRKEHRGRYDIVTARAVAKLPVLLEWLLPLVCTGGSAVAYKSRDVEQETEQARPVAARLGGRIDRVAEVPLPNTTIVRKIIVIKK